MYCPKNYPCLSNTMTYIFQLEGNKLFVIYLLVAKICCSLTTAVYLITAKHCENCQHQQLSSIAAIARKFVALLDFNIMYYLLRDMLVFIDIISRFINSFS